MVKKLLLTVIGGLSVAALLIGLTVAGGWYGLRWYAQQPVALSADTEFVISRGDYLGRVVERLAAANVVRYPELFALFARVEGAAEDLHAGEYLISPGTTNSQLLTKFITGDIRDYSITLVEGLTLKELLVALNQHPKLVQPMTLAELRTAIKPDIEGVPETENLEGLFFADTYRFPAGTAVSDVLDRAHEQLKLVLNQEWVDRAEGLPYQSPYQALIMASIIEKETGAPSERPDIAGVFVRRLEKKMRLQTDPTVIYGLGERYAGKLNRSMLRELTPYNTYRISGLPPTPIASVGRDAINAALNPASGQSLYFVARGDGTHHFSNTLSEHNQAVRKYQITERREDYRSTVN